MPDDRDDLDPVLRRAMASLDGEVPPGYFDALPARVLARLDDPAIGAVASDDAAASSSVGPAVALPEPGPARPPAELGASAAAAAAPAASAADSLASARGTGARGRRTARIAIAGLGIAVAASAAIYLGARGRDPGNSPTIAASTPAGAPASAPAVPASQTSSGAGSATGPGTASGPGVAPGSGVMPGATIASGTPGPGVAPSNRPAAGKRAGVAQLPDVQGELGGAKSKPGVRRHDRTSLSADDIKRGMTAVADPARRCYASAQGQVSLRLTVAPSGEVASVTVTGAFAGTPVAGCVERAVRGARFPPWDGRPQSFGYSYLPSDQAAAPPGLSHRNR